MYLPRHDQQLQPPAGTDRHQTGRHQRPGPLAGPRGLPPPGRPDPLGRLVPPLAPDRPTPRPPWGAASGSSRPTPSGMRATPRTTARPHRNAARSGLLPMGIIAAGCQAGGQPEATTLRPTAAAQTGTIATSPASSSAPAPSSAGTVLPVGALNPDVTQSNIATTICVRGWTATVRPPETYTTTLKVRQLAALAYADQNPADYEEDHIIPLELGGAP